MRKKGLIFLFIYPFLIISSQKWEVKIANDNFFSVLDSYSDNKNYNLLIQLTNSNKKYTYQNKITNKKEVSFPLDFQIILGDSNISFNEKFQLDASIDKAKIFQVEYIYQPNPKGFYQLKPERKNLSKYIKNNREKTIDQYSWEDSFGKNYFIRTELSTLQYKYLYFYHFLKKDNDKEVVLIHKCSDKQGVSSGRTNHKIESIQITDININKVAEISCFYYIGGKTKLILITEKKKYYLRQSEKRNIDFEPCSNLKIEKEYLRFMKSKWKKEVTK